MFHTCVTSVQPECNDNRGHDKCPSIASLHDSELNVAHLHITLQQKYTNPRLHVLAHCSLRLARIYLGYRENCSEKIVNVTRDITACYNEQSIL